MKYLTKEWYEDLKLLCLCDSLKADARAEDKDEAFYEEVRRSEYEFFLKCEKARDIYYTPEQRIERLNAFVGEKGISEEERARRHEFGMQYIQMPQTEEYYEFDEDSVRKKFEVLQRTNELLLGKLPEEILDEVADIRVLALGYASRRVRRMIDRYSAGLEETCDRASELAEQCSNEAMAMLGKRFDSEFGEEALAYIKRRGNEIAVGFADGTEVVFKDGEIVGNAGRYIYRWDEETPDSGLSHIVAWEFDYEHRRYVLRLLIEDLDEDNHSEMWCTEISGSDVIM